MGVLTAAAGHEPELEELRQATHESRRENLRTPAVSLEETGALRSEVEAATDTIWALASPELYALLRGLGGWTADRYEHWLTESLATLLVSP